MDRRIELGCGRAMASRAHVRESRRAATRCVFNEAVCGFSRRRAQGTCSRAVRQGTFRFRSPMRAGGRMISLAGKAALITGGSRGIGAAAVKLFAQAGADVVFNYHRSRGAVEQVEQEARKHGTRVESFKADLGRMADAGELVKYAVERLGHLDILVA